METAEPIKEFGKVTNPAILGTFDAIRREDFVPLEIKLLASLNEALPIGYGQTISQPLVVSFMLELLELKEGQKILDIGAGSGWTTALLAHIVGAQGKVVALELIPEIAAFGKKNVEKYGFMKKGIARYLCQDGSKGYIYEAPYDRILASASLAKKEIPLAWREQLRIGGKIVVPIQNSIWVFTKKDKKTLAEQEYPGFVFVPFVS